MSRRDYLALAFIAAALLLAWFASKASPSTKNPDDKNDDPGPF